MLLLFKTVLPTMNTNEIFYKIFFFKRNILSNQVRILSNIEISNINPKETFWNTILKPCFPTIQITRPPATNTPLFCVQPIQGWSGIPILLGDPKKGYIFPGFLAANVDFKVLLGIKSKRLVFCSNACTR